MNQQPIQNTTSTPTSAPTQISDRGFLLTLLLCFFFGALGVHRFYVGKIGTGFLMLFTLGGFGIWALVVAVFFTRSMASTGE
jgi:TM2 domain-containing membrane protein YozV